MRGRGGAPGWRRSPGGLAAGGPALRALAPGPPAPTVPAAEQGIDVEMSALSSSQCSGSAFVSAMGFSGWGRGVHYWRTMAGAISLSECLCICDGLAGAGEDSTGGRCSGQAAADILNTARLAPTHPDESPHVKAAEQGQGQHSRTQRRHGRLIALTSSNAVCQSPSRIARAPPGPATCGPPPHHRDGDRLHPGDCPISAIYPADYNSIKQRGMLSTAMPT